jgi:hypothetical protein
MKGSKYSGCFIPVSDFPEGSPEKVVIAEGYATAVSVSLLSDAWPLAALGGSTIAALQATGAGVYYNTSVQLCGRTVKYGVIECASLLDDLKHWRSLYIAGRAHKPVRPLRELPAELELLVANNLRSALSAALLLLPLRFDDAGLFGTICGLSYSGDVRMGIGESPRKPGDIADGQRDALAELYRGPLAEATGSIGGSVGSRSSVVAAVVSGAASARVQDDRLPARQSLLAALPSVAKDGLVDDLLGMVAGGRFRTHSPHCSRQLLLEASERLWRSSATATPPQSAGTGPSLHRPEPGLQDRWAAEHPSWTPHSNWTAVRIYA